ncbi:hypothetical protein HYX01_01080 [Candidatus Woesearchaeota archaeon]|nr:hypothetical protein [Candidatus Woesearchaeota archaeon]
MEKSIEEIVDALGKHLRDYYTTKGMGYYSGKKFFREVDNDAIHADNILFGGQMMLNGASMTLETTPIKWSRERPIKNLEKRKEAALKEICERFDKYAAVSQAFSEKYRQELVDIYKKVLYLYQNYQGARDEKLTVIENANSGRLEALQNGQAIYPKHLESLTVALGFLMPERIDIGDFKKRVEALKSNYRQIFYEQMSSK